MAFIVQGARKPLVSIAEISYETLVQWRLEYFAVDEFGPESPPLRATVDDRVDTAYFESLISHALLTTLVSKGFCNRCLDLFNHWPSLGTKSWTHGIGRSYHSAQIEAATRQGCRCCSFLFARLNDSKSLSMFRRIEQRLHLLDDHSSITLSIENWGVGGETQLLWLNLPGKTTKDCNSWMAQYTKFESHGVPLSFYSESRSDHFELIKRWLRRCLCCNATQLERPSRLIYVKGDMIRLVSTSSWEMMPPYATLSYCWGSGNFPKLTEDSLNTLFDTIPQDSLPQVFRDAIQVTHAVGLEYLWIDALCIVQGIQDKSDWLKESNLMRSIYGGSHLNIAAASSTGAHQGCLPTTTNSCTGFLARISTDKFCRVQNFHSMSVYEDATTDSHVASRAWTLQERLLAPRTVYLSENGLFWECRSKIASDSLPDGFPGKLGSNFVRSPNKPWDWADIVYQYSKAKLTESTDKLPALSGIAQRQQEVTGDEYLAGMWRERLVKQLHWRSDGPTARPKWRAPTWSWTSVDGTVNCYWSVDSPAATEYAQVTSASITLAGENRFGLVRSGELQLSCAAILRGEYCKSLIESKEQDCVRVALETGQLLLPILLDCSEGDSVKIGSALHVLPLYRAPSGTRRIVSSSKDKAHSDADSEDQSEDSSIAELMICGTILRSINHDRSHFQRVGSFYLETWEDNMSEEYTTLSHSIENIDESFIDSQDIRCLLDDESSILRFKVIVF